MATKLHNRHRPLVIYHSNCTDGLGAAWCFKRAYGYNIELFPGVYQRDVEKVLEAVEGRDVFMVDFSYPPEMMVKILQLARQVTLLDHHKSALDACKLMPKFENFDMQHCTIEKSGAMIAWDYLTKDVGLDLGKMPPLLAYIQDRDLWHFKLANTKAIIRAINVQRLSMDRLSYYMSFDEDRLLTLRDQGEAIIGAEKSVMESILNECARQVKLPLANSSKTVTEVAFDLCNVPGHFFSDCGELWYTAHNAPLLMYYDTATHRVFGLRANKACNIDVGQVAKQFGGGGHELAAGFKVDRGHWLAQL